MILSLIGPAPYNTNFLSETDKLEAKYLEAAEVSLQVQNGNINDIQLKELHQLKSTANGRVKSDSLFWKEFDSVLPDNSDLCNSLHPENGALDNRNINEYNPRVSQIISSSLVKVLIICNCHTLYICIFVKEQVLDNILMI